MMEIRYVKMYGIVCPLSMYSFLHKVNGSSMLKGCGAAVKTFVGKYNTNHCVETCSRRIWHRQTASY